jgi:hypothetical protein
MKKAQKDLNFKFFASLTFILAALLFPNLYFFIIQAFLSRPTVLLLLPSWFLSIYLFTSKRVFGFKLRKETKYRALFYSIFITFIVFYFTFISHNFTLILAQTPLTRVCECYYCGLYSSCSSCSEWQDCIQQTCLASGCAANTNCYKCEWKSCSNVQSKVYILTPFIVSGGNLSISVVFECREWSSSAKNLTLSLKIDNQDWKECFLNNKGLMTDFGWSNNCNNMMSGNCGSNNQWSCDSQAYCKHQNYNLWVKSNFNNHYVNVTFTCKLPYLSGGSHSLTVIAKVYGSEITLKPSIITFRVFEASERKIFEVLLFPIKILRNLLPF